MSLLISSTSSSVTPWFSDLRCSWIVHFLLWWWPWWRWWCRWQWQWWWQWQWEGWQTSVTYRRTRFCMIVWYCSSFSLAKVILCWMWFCNIDPWITVFLLDSWWRWWCSPWRTWRDLSSLDWFSQYNSEIGSIQSGNGDYDLRMNTMMIVWSPFWSTVKTGVFKMLQLGRLRLSCNRSVSVCHKTILLKASNDNRMKSNNDDYDSASDVYYKDCSQVVIWWWQWCWWPSELGWC